MGQEEAFQSNSERIFNNVKNLKNNHNYLEVSHSKNLFRPSKSMFEFLYVVGRGGFGKVWMVKYKKTQEKYALKEMSKVKIIDRKSEKSIKNEREFLSQLHHPFIVNMICSFQDYENLYLVMDLLTGGDLRYHICHKKQFNEEQARFFSSCILLGLEYIHLNNIIHRDIKPENLVLDQKGYVRITDFGVAKKNLRDNSSETSGTPGYMAPEVLCAFNHSFPVDFFALGVIIFEFMNGYRPYLGRNRKEIKEAVLAKQIHVHRKQLFENGWSFESGDLINKLLYRKPHKRLGCNGIKQIKEHAWFKNIKWDELFDKKMKSPFVPKDGDNFDKRYCEGIEQIDTQTKERYQYYKSKSRFKTLFINYTFVREEHKQEYINLHNKNNNMNKNIKNSVNTNFITTTSTKGSGSLGNNNKYNGNNNMSSKQRNTNSMTNIHSFSIINDNNNNKKKKSSNRNHNLIKYDKNHSKNDELNIEEENTEENQKLFYSTFKIKNNQKNNKIFSDNINESENENTINVDFKNKLDELKVYLNKKEENKIKNKDLNINHSYYVKEKSKDNIQFRSTSLLTKRQNDYFYSMNGKRLNNQVSDNNNNNNNNNINNSNNKYYNINNDNNNSNNQNYTSIKININAPININKYKCNRSSSQTNIFYDTKGIKSNSGKMIKYINIDEEIMDKSHPKLNQESKHNNTRNYKNKYKNNNNSNSNSNNIYINPSQFIYYPSHKNNSLMNNLSNTLKKDNNKYNSPINSVNMNKGNNEYLMYKTSRYFNDRNKRIKGENQYYYNNRNNNEENSSNISNINNINNINNNNININFNINNINNNINNINEINSDNFNNTNIINNKRKSTSKVKGANSVNTYHNNNQKKYIYSNINNSNNNIYVVQSFLKDNSQNKINNNSNQYNRYSKNNIVIECDDYDAPKYSNNKREYNIKNKTLSKASSMKSFNFSSTNYIEKYLDQKEINNNNKNVGKVKKSTNNNNNNIYYNFEIISPELNNEGSMSNNINNIIIEDNCCETNYKNNNMYFRKQKTQAIFNNKPNNIVSSGWQQQNKYGIFKKNIE